MNTVDYSAPDAPRMVTVGLGLAVKSHPQGQDFPDGPVAEAPVKRAASVAYNIDLVVDSLFEEMKRCERTETMAA